LRPPPHQFCSPMLARMRDQRAEHLGLVFQEGGVDTATRAAPIGRPSVHGRDCDPGRTACRSGRVRHADATGTAVGGLGQGGGTRQRRSARWSGCGVCRAGPGAGGRRV
jgi:hypothetical protein